MVKRRTMDARNAAARRRRRAPAEALAWCEQWGVEISRWQTAWGNWRCTVKAIGFHPVTDETLEAAVAQLRPTLERWVAGPEELGPTGGMLRRYRGGTDGR